MTYEINNKSIANNLKEIIIPLFFGILVLIFWGDNIRAVIAITVITLTLLMPQIYLAIQYVRFTNFRSFEINYEEEEFHIKKLDSIIHKKFSDLKTIQCHKAFVPNIYLSLAFSLSQHFYYY